VITKAELSQVSKSPHLQSQTTVRKAGEQTPRCLMAEQKSHHMPAVHFRNLRPRASQNGFDRITDGNDLATSLSVNLGDRPCPALPGPARIPFRAHGPTFAAFEGIL
jgi:hypothetical protein